MTIAPSGPLAATDCTRVIELAPWQFSNADELGDSAISDASSVSITLSVVRYAEESGVALPAEGIKHLKATASIPSSTGSIKRASVSVPE